MKKSITVKAMSFDLDFMAADLNYHHYLPKFASWHLLERVRASPSKNEAQPLNNKTAERICGGNAKRQKRETEVSLSID